MADTRLSTIAVPYPANSVAYAAPFAHWPGFVWLDSGTRREYCGQYDLITAQPSQMLSAYSHTNIELTQDGYTRPISLAQLNVWCEEQTKLSNTAEPDQSLPFSGGLLGYIGYEWNHPNFKLTAPNTRATPLLQLGVYDWALIIDHERRVAYWMFTAEIDPAHQAAIMQQLNAPLPPPEIFNCAAFTPQTSKAQYLEDVEKILEFIQAGDCYQVNYSQAFNARFSGDAFSAYTHLRTGCPGPFSAYISTAEGAILSLSPEQFIQVDADNIATSRPIKGTALRQAQAQLDTNAANALQNSIKNRAENLMIVDLLRNDFSKNCCPGSVNVPELFGLYSFTNVHHLISTVEGRLRELISHWQFINDAFPGGSITGAPKKRSMEIIQQLEPHQRHIYCGCIGFFSRNGNTRTNIAIRTLLIEQNQITVWGGGGIVADSIAEDEYQESMDKIAIFKSILTKQIHIDN